MLHLYSGNPSLIALITRLKLIGQLRFRRIAFIITGFDSKWVYLSREDRNHILNYQLKVRTPDSERSGIVLSDGPDLGHRWKLPDLLGRVIHVAHNEVIGHEWPYEIYANTQD